jgi:hypothetical protein
MSAITPAALLHASAKQLLPWLAAIAFALKVAPLSMRSVRASYTLSLAVFIPISGWMAERFGTAVGVVRQHSRFSGMPEFAADQLAVCGNPRAVKFTSPKMKGNELDFSFSGMKTAVPRWTQAQASVGDEVAARRSRLAWSR